MDQAPRSSGRVRALPSRFNNYEPANNARTMRAPRAKSRFKPQFKRTTKKNIQRMSNRKKALLARSEDEIWWNSYNANNLYKIEITYEMLKKFLDSIGLEEVYPENTEIRLIKLLNAHVYANNHVVGFYDLDDLSLHTEMPPELVILMRYINKKLEKERVVKFNNLIGQVI
jgi:hypothetical protein